MQKIVTREDQEKKSKRNKLIIGIILVVLMVFSTAGYALFQGSKGDNINSVSFKGVKFQLLEDGLWHGTINKIEYAISYNPRDTENISANIVMNLTSYSNQNLYFSNDSNREAVNEITNNLGRFLVRAPQYVCLANCSQDLPVKNCANNIIIAEEVNSTSLIKQENKCIYILASKENLLKATDAFILKIAGI